MKRIVMLGLLALAAAACSDDGDGDGASTTIASTAVPTSLLTTPPTVTPPVTIGPAPVADAAALVEDCVAYVPTAIYFGNFYMKAIWDLGGGTPEGLRQVCEGMVTSDPDGLRRMSAEYADLQNLAASATTAAP